MSNLSENRTNTVLTQQAYDEMKAAVQKFIDLLPPNTTLTDEQRLRFSAINVSNKVFAEDVLAESKIIGSDILPAFVDIDALEKDLVLFKQLDEQENALHNALQRLQDAKRIAGHEAYGQSTLIYNSIKMASDAGIPNAKAAYTKLKTRFDAQGSGGRKPLEEI